MLLGDIELAPTPSSPGSWQIKYLVYLGTWVYRRSRHGAGAYRESGLLLLISLRPGCDNDRVPTLVPIALFDPGDEVKLYSSTY